MNGRKCLEVKINKALNVKEHKQYLKSRIELYQALNFIYNTDYVFLDILYEMRYMILFYVTFKNGRIKPAWLDDITRHIQYEILTERAVII